MPDTTHTGFTNSHRAGQSVGPQDQSGGGVFSAASESALSLHAYLFVLAEPSGVVVRQDPA